MYRVKPGCLLNRLSGYKRVYLLTCFCSYELCVCESVCFLNHIKNAAQPPASTVVLIKTSSHQVPDTCQLPSLIITSEATNIHFSSLCMHTRAHVCVCVWSVNAYETGRHTSMKSAKPPLIPPVIYGSQIHVRLKLNKRSFVTDSSL